MSNLLAESSAYTKLGRKWMEMDLTTFDYEIQAIEMTEVALRSRQVAAASGNDLCSQVAPLDWRRPTQCLLTLRIKR